MATGKGERKKGFISRFFRKNRSSPGTPDVSIAGQEDKDGVLFLLPRWGEGMSGIYSTAHSIMYQLKQEGQSVSCVLGTTLAELSEREKAHVKQLGVKILEPYTEDEEQPISPEERVQNDDAYDELYGHVVTVIEQICKIVSLSQTTNQLAKYLLHKGEASKCELVLFTHQASTSQDEMNDLADVARSAKAVFSVGHDAFQFFNQSIQTLLGSDISHYLFTPDYSGICGEQHSDQPKRNQVFVPWSEYSDESFSNNCICAANLYNDELRKAGKHDQVIDIVVQTVANGNDQNVITCPTMGHTHQNFKCVTYSSTEEIMQEAKSSGLVLASGQFTETGFSGMEFIMNGCLVFIPDGTDVAATLKLAHPEISKSFLLSKVNNTTKSRKQASLSRWQRKIDKIQEGRESLIDEYSSIMQLMQQPSESTRNVLEIFGATSERQVLAVPKRNLNLTEKNILGRGASGDVYKLYKDRAVKVIKYDGKTNMASALKEIKVFEKL